MWEIISVLKVYLIGDLYLTLKKYINVINPQRKSWGFFFESRLKIGWSGIKGYVS